MCSFKTGRGRRGGEGGGVYTPLPSRKQRQGTEGAGTGPAVRRSGQREQMGQSAGGSEGGGQTKKIREKPVKNAVTVTAECSQMLTSHIRDGLGRDRTVQPDQDSNSIGF